jgi:ATP-dependent DNA helicase RecQ
MASLGVPVRGNIPADQRLSPGRALARLTDLGWGGPLRELFEGGPAGPATPDAAASDAMIRACFRVLADWDWADRPEAVVAVPSRRHPLLVDSVARAFADAGRLPLLGSLELVDGGPPGTSGGNSAYRLAGLWGRFAVGAPLSEALAPFAGRPILLVDDLADSRWTLTVAGSLLRTAGAGAVLPFALALKA